MAEQQDVKKLSIPTNAFEYNGHYYYIYSNVTSTWEESKNYCENLGGNLAVINDAAENTALFNYMKSQGYNSAYFGLSDAAQEGNWRWVDNTPVTYTNWANGEPNSERSNEDYAEFYYKFTDGKWNDGNFNKGTVGDSNNFICEWTPIKKVEIPADAFEYNGHYYKIFQDGMTWQQAKSFCENLGGHLVTITDSAEQSFVKNLLEKETAPKNSYWLGGYKDSSNNWIWTTGENWNYTNWAYRQPDGDGKALMMYYNSNPYSSSYLGEWNDLNENGTYGSEKFFGTQNFGFICEWDNLREESTEIDSATTLEVINLFATLSATEKKSALKENLESLQKIKTLIEGDKKIEIVDEETSNIFYTDSKNLFDCINAYYDDDAAPIITEYTNYIHDSKGRIVYKRKYKRDSAGNIVRDANNQPIREFELDANGNKIKIENQSEHRKFMGNMLGYVTDFYSIYGSLEKINSGNLNGVEKTAEISKLSGSVVSLIGNIRELGDFDKAGTIAPIASALLGLTGSIISLCDGVKAEEIVDVVQETLKSSLIISKYALQPEFASTKIGHLLGGNSFVTTKIKPLAETLNANALKANLGVAVALGLVMGGVQYFKSNEQYQIDGLKDSLALKDKWTDAFSAGMKTFYSTVTLGLDDAIFGFASNLVYLGEWFGTLITGGDVSKVKKMSAGGKNYMELFGDFVKLVFFNQYTDAEGDDGGYMENTKVGRNIYSGGGNDSINNKASKANIYSGTGNDLIFCAEGTNQQYIDGGNDNDKIALYGSSNEIHGGLGDDEITIFGDNKNPAAGNYILGEAGNDYIWLGDSKSKKNSNVANTIDGGEGDDIIFIDLTKTSNTILYKNGDGDDSIYGYDSNDKIIINKSDYTSITSGDDVKISIGDGSITLFDAKDKKINIEKTNDDIYPTGITANNSKTALNINNKFRGGNIYLDNYAETFSQVNASGLSKTQPVEIIGDDSANYLKGGKSSDTISGGAGDDTVYGGDGDDIIDGGNGNDILHGDAGNDILSGGKGDNILTGNGGNDIFVHDGGEDFISDYKAGADKIFIKSGIITDSFLSDSKSIILVTSGGSVAVKNGKNQKITVIDSSGNETTNIYPIYNTPAGISIKDNILTASKDFAGNEINLADYTGVRKINASALSKAVEINGTVLNDSLKGGKGADKIYGYLGNDTLTGGAGADTFIYSEGNDIITDYKPGEDKISADYSTSTVKGSDVILTTDYGNLTIKGAKDKVISFTDGSEKIFFADISYAPFATGLTYDAKRTVLTASNKFTGAEIDLANYLSTVTKVNAYAVKNAVAITGNTLNNDIKGGKGADIISGGAGNDTLTGGKGADTFIYSAGNDTITDYATEDEIQINGTISNTSYSGKNVIFTIGSGTLTVKNGKGKKISVNNSIINARTLDLLDDTNFLTDENNLDSITEKKFAVTQIQSSNNETLAQDSTLLTFTKEK